MLISVLRFLWLRSSSFSKVHNSIALHSLVSIAPNNCIELQWLSLSILLSLLMGFAMHFEGVLFHCFRRCRISLSLLRHYFRRRTRRRCRVSSSPLPFFTNNVPLKPQLIQKNIQMRLFQITAFVNRIYKCDSIAAFVFL